MAQRSVKMSADFVQIAETESKAMCRSTGGQIEYWAQVGRIAEQNPDLSYPLIRDLLISLEQAKNGELTDYVFSDQD